MKEIKISNKEENQRLDKFLLKYLNKSTKSFIYKMLRKKRIKLNQAKACGNEILKDGDSLTLYLSDETMDSFIEKREIDVSSRHFGIIYEDDNILIVNKPPGLLCHPTHKDDKDTLIQQIWYYLSDKGEYKAEISPSFTPAICNRIDRNTSGIVIAGKNLQSVQAVNEIIANNKLSKFYIALVKGNIIRQGRLTGDLVKNGEKNKVFIVKHGEGRHVESMYAPLLRNENVTLLSIRLLTGRSHQIRAQLSFTGHPICGDRKYGDEVLNDYFKTKFGLVNQFLHAAEVCFDENNTCLKYLNNKSFKAKLPAQLENIKNEIFEI